MKKTFAKILSVTLALMLLVSIAVVPAAAAENEYVCGLGLVASDWSTSTDFGANSSVQTTVTGDGTYTLSYDGACADIGILVVDIIGAQADLDANGQTYAVTDLKLTIDGNEVAVDLAKVLTGDLEENGNYRIDLYNMYGDSKNDPSLDNTLAVTENLTLTFTIETVDAAAESEGVAAPMEIPSEFVCGLGLVASDWSTSTDFGASSAVQTTVTGDGTYTLSYDGACADLGIVVVDIIGAQEALGSNGLTYQVTELTLTIDGQEVAVDLSKVLTGDLEENGNYRIDLYNMYGDSAADPALDNTLAVAENLTLTFTIATVEYVAEEPVEETEPAAEVDLNGTYNVYLMLQTPNWTYRDAWNSGNGIGSDYFGSFIYGNETSEKYGVVTDAVIAGNGIYTVSVTDFGTIFADDFAAAGQDYFNILGLSTDIPLNDSIQITDVKLIIDGSTRHSYKEGFLDPDETEYMKVLVQNIWNENVKELSYYPAPTTSLEIQFTVSGFAYDNAEQAVEETEPVATEPVVEEAEGGNATGIIIAVVAVAAVAVVAVVVMKKKKAA